MRAPILEAYEEIQEMMAAWIGDNGDGGGEVYKAFQRAQPSSMVKGSSFLISPEEIQDIRMNLCYF